MGAADAATVTMPAAIRRLGTDWAGEPMLRHVAMDGSVRELSGGWLAQRAAQVAGAMAARGVGQGDRIDLACVDGVS